MLHGVVFASEITPNHPAGFTLHISPFKVSFTVFFYLRLVEELKHGVLLPISWEKVVQDSRGQGFKGLFSKNFISGFNILSISAISFFSVPNSPISIKSNILKLDIKFGILAYIDTYAELEKGGR